MHAVAHVLDNRVAAGDPDVFFAHARRTGSTYVLIEKEPRADDRRIADPARNFPGEPAGCGDAGHFAFLVQRETVDGSIGRMDRLVPCPGKRTVVDAGK